MIVNKSNKIIKVISGKILFLSSHLDQIYKRYNLREKKREKRMKLIRLIRRWQGINALTLGV